jgi:hypothetical protein
MTLRQAIGNRPKRLIGVLRIPNGTLYDIRLHAVSQPAKVLAVLAPIGKEAEVTCEYPSTLDVQDLFQSLLDSAIPRDSEIECVLPGACIEDIIHG